MKHAILAATALALVAAPADAAKRNYGVSGFDRIRVDGDYRVNLTVGIAPYARAEGSMRSLDGVSIRVEGRTLVIRTNTSATWGGFPDENDGPVEISIGTHELTAAWINGAGSLAINKVRGLKFEGAVQGAGLLSIDQMDVDQLDLSLAGAASARLGGEAKKVTTIVRGSSNFDGASLTSKDAVIGAQGPAIVSLIATGTAKVDAIGVGTVTLSGNPSCTLNVKGSASVKGCKPSRRY